MGTSQITIRKHHAAARCEVCHQTDCFDPTSETCTRCSTAIRLSRTGLQPVRALPPPGFLLAEPAPSLEEEAAQWIFYFACFWPVEILLLIDPCMAWNRWFPDYAISNWGVLGLHLFLVSGLCFWLEHRAGEKVYRKTLATVIVTMVYLALFGIILYGLANPYG